MIGKKLWVKRGRRYENMGRRESEANQIIRRENRLQVGGKTTYFKNK